MTEPCSICENYANGTECDENKCPVYLMKKENEKLKSENRRLRKNQDDGYPALTIGDSHEMGVW